MCHRVIAHFTNLPWILPADGLPDARSSWLGRRLFSGGGWDLTLDVRPDHDVVSRELRHSVVFAITHVGELRRTDRSAFTGQQASDALYAYQVGLSFALGRWIAPVAPVGFDGDGHPVWELWAPWRCDPMFGHLSWWDSHNGDDLADFLRLYLRAWFNPNEHDVFRHVAHHMIAANERRMTVEARIMLIQAALEYLSWVTYVLAGHRSAGKHNEGRSRAERHLRELLEKASIPRQIPQDLTALLRYAADENLADGPAALTSLRNRLVHPKDASEPYRIERLVSDAWRLAGEYGDLLLLNRLGYEGHYVPRTRTGGWAHDRLKVPWA
jgi:hypothetical protein